MASIKDVQTMKPRKPSRLIAHSALSCAAMLLVIMLFFSTFSFSLRKYDHHQFLGRVCDEIYVVGEGETLHTISDKCGDPFIIEQNPHIHDPDDVFPGLVIKITPATTSSK